MSQSSKDRLVRLTRKRGMSESDFAEMCDQLSQQRARKLDGADEAVGLYAETLAESVFTDGQSGVPDCRTCGACCAFFHQIAVLDIDPTPRRLTWAVWDDEAAAGPKTRWLRREADEGHCVAFKGGVGRSAHCAIYELRPASCRAFAAGSDRCRAVRRAYGLEPPLSEDERIEHARRIVPDASGEWDRVEALERREPLSFGKRERARLLAEMIAYHRARIREIANEAERLQSLLAGQGRRSPAQMAARYVRAINEEARAVTANGEAGIEATALLDVAAQSQAAFTRAARWLAALGELVFDALEMRAEMASAEPINESREAEC